jgi:hypothetical protein
MLLVSKAYQEKNKIRSLSAFKQKMAMGLR